MRSLILRPFTQLSVFAASVFAGGEAGAQKQQQRQQQQQSGVLTEESFCFAIHRMVEAATALEAETAAEAETERF